MQYFSLIDFQELHHINILSNLLLDANQVIVCPVFAEKKKKFSLNKFCRDIILNSKTEVVQVDNKNQIDVYLKKNLLNNEIVIAMGAGNISSWIRYFKKLKI